MNYVVIYATLCKAFESTAFSLMLTLTCFKGYNLLMKNLNECDALVRLLNLLLHLMSTMFYKTI